MYHLSWLLDTNQHKDSIFQLRQVGKHLKIGEHRSRELVKRCQGIARVSLVRKWLERVTKFHSWGAWDALRACVLLCSRLLFLSPKFYRLWFIYTLSIDIFETHCMQSIVLGAKNQLQNQEDPDLAFRSFAGMTVPDRQKECSVVDYERSQILCCSSHQGVKSLSSLL